MPKIALISLKHWMLNCQNTVCVPKQSKSMWFHFKKIGLLYPTHQTMWFQFKETGLLCPTHYPCGPILQLFPAVSKEALSADLLCIGEDHERVRIDFRDQLPQDDSLLLGDGDQKNRSVLAGIHARSG